MPVCALNFPTCFHDGKPVIIAYEKAIYEQPCDRWRGKAIYEQVFYDALNPTPPIYHSPPFDWAGNLLRPLIPSTPRMLVFGEKLVKSCPEVILGSAFLLLQHTLHPIPVFPSSAPRPLHALPIDVTVEMTRLSVRVIHSGSPEGESPQDVAFEMSYATPLWELLEKHAANLNRTMESLEWHADGKEVLKVSSPLRKNCLAALLWVSC
jgi:hypothetical protein